MIDSYTPFRATIPGGGAPEMELSHQLSEWARTLPGAAQICVKAYADALEVIPYTLAENAGLNPIQIVTDLRNKHAEGQKHAGINVRKGCISNILEENVVQVRGGCIHNLLFCVEWCVRVMVNFRIHVIDLVDVL
jgi:T-complex protein 1 subunit delta